MWMRCGAGVSGAGEERMWLWYHRLPCLPITNAARFVSSGRQPLSMDVGHSIRTGIEAPVKLTRVAYKSLNAKQKEAFNFQKSAAMLADYGFNCIKLADDWRGADFLAYHKDGNQTLRVQLKARLTIDRKYCGQGLWMNFPVGKNWYLVEHDELVRIVGDMTTWLGTRSWMDKGRYSSVSPSRPLLEQLATYRVGGAE